MATKNCAICGKASGIYPLCREHLQMKADGKVVKCEECGTWHLIGSPCQCKKHEVVKAEPTTDVESELTCIICGEPSNGKHFCYKCYRKYKDRSVDIRITHCVETEILDEYGTLQYKCDDGRRVRSRAEAMISNFFFKEKVRAVYEETIYYEENNEQKTLHPDFFLPDYDLYIEYNELTNKPYLRQKEYANEIYVKLGKKVLILDDNDLRDLAACLKPKLGLH